MVKLNIVFKYIKLIVAIIFLTPIYLFLLINSIPLVLLEIFMYWFSVLSGNEWIQKYTYKQVISMDQTMNALLAGDEDETISGRIGRRIPNSWFAWLVNHIYFWQANHVVEADADESKDIGKNDLI